MIIDDLPSISIANDSDEIAIEQGTATKKITKGNFLQELNTALGAMQAEILNDALYFTGKSLTVTTGQILDISDSRITTDHVLARIEFSDPSKITTDVTWNTDTAGHFKLLNGTCTGTCTANVVLVKKS